MMDRPGRKPKPITPDGCCMNCEWAKSKFRESCYCVKYGIVIGYTKITCKGWKHEQETEATPVLRMG